MTLWWLQNCTQAAARPIAIQVRCLHHVCWGDACVSQSSVLAQHFHALQGCPRTVSDEASLAGKLTSSSKKRVGDAATERCLFSVPDGVRETTDADRAATGVSAEAATAFNLVVPTPCSQCPVVANFGTLYTHKFSRVWHCKWYTHAETLMKDHNGPRLPALCCPESLGTSARK